MLFVTEWFELEVRMETEYVNCDLCGDDNFFLLFIDNNYRLVKCKTCGLVYVNPRPKKEGIVRKKENNYQKYLLSYTDYPDSHYLRAKRL